jgi:hypothetical protein
LKLFGHGIETVGLLIDAIRKRFGHLGKFALGLLLLELCFHRGAQLFEARLAGDLDVCQQNDVVPEIGFHHFTDIPFIHRKRCVFKGLDHGAQPKEIQVAARRRRPSVFRGFFSNFRKSGGGLADLLEQLGCASLGFFSVCRRGILERIDQNMAGATLFLACKTGYVFLVIGAQVVFVQRDARPHTVDVQHQVFHRRLLGLLEISSMGLVVALQIGIGWGHLARKIRRVEARNLHFAALVQGIQRQLDLRIGAEGGPHHPTHDLVHRNIPTHIGFEAFRRQPLGTDQCTVRLGIQGTVGAAELGNGRNLLQTARQAAVAGDEVHFWAAA